MCCVVVTCQPGRYLLNGRCYTECPFTYYPVNVTSVPVSQGSSGTVVGVCSHCGSVGVCARLLRLLLTVVGVVACVVVLAMLLVCGCLRGGVCQRRPTHATSVDGIVAAQRHSPRYITNGHIIGLSSKPLLAASDSDSSDESELPSDSASHNHI